ncbi:MAG: endonuclease domain-containing protein [Acidobacteriota bacterium]
MQRRGAPREIERHLRQSMTDAERLVWAILRERRLARWKFRRQHRLEIAIVDFYCPRLRLAFELDGDPHFTEAGRAADLSRDERLANAGIAVLRFENVEVESNPGLSAEKIARVCEERAAALGLR